MIETVSITEREEDMKQRKRGIRQMFTGAMAVLMVLSAVNVSGWGRDECEGGGDCSAGK